MNKLRMTWGLYRAADKPGRKVMRAIARKAMWVNIKKRRGAIAFTGAAGALSVGAAHPTIERKYPAVTEASRYGLGVAGLFGSSHLLARRFKTLAKASSPIRREAKRMATQVGNLESMLVRRQTALDKAAQGHMKVAQEFERRSAELAGTRTSHPDHTRLGDIVNKLEAAKNKWAKAESGLRNQMIKVREKMQLIRGPVGEANTHPLSEAKQKSEIMRGATLPMKKWSRRLSFVGGSRGIPLPGAAGIALGAGVVQTARHESARRRLRRRLMIARGEISNG